MLHYPHRGMRRFPPAPCPAPLQGWARCSVPALPDGAVRSELRHPVPAGGRHRFSVLGAPVHPRRAYVHCPQRRLCGNSRNVPPPAAAPPSRRRASTQLEPRWKVVRAGSGSRWRDLRGTPAPRGSRCARETCQIRRRESARELKHRASQVLCEAEARS